MKKIVFTLFICMSLSIYAADNPKSGQEKSMVCSACHGADGMSINPDWPHLAGQHATYLQKQLLDFQHGKTRHSAVMTPLVAQLSAQDIADLAAFYAQKKLVRTPSSVRLTARGQQLYRSGDFSQHITACIACHGPDGTGNEQAGYPVLAGQQPAYIIQQLQAFKQKQRSNDINSIMRDIAARMSTEDMEAVAYYIRDR